MIHRYWTGPEKPQLVRDNDAAWESLHPGGVKLWDDGSLPDGCLEWVTAREPDPADLDDIELVGGTTETHRANLVRLWLLRDLGGLWADADTCPHRYVFDHLDERPAIACRANGRPNTSIIWVPDAGAAWIAATCDGIRWDPDLPIPAIAGNEWVAQTVPEFDVALLPAGLWDVSPGARPDAVIVSHAYMSMRGRGR